MDELSHFCSLQNESIAMLVLISHLYATLTGSEALEIHLKHSA